MDIYVSGPFVMELPRLSSLNQSSLAANLFIDRSGKDLKLELDTGASWVLSPTANYCWEDEDFIGRVCRLTRQGHGRIFPTVNNSIIRAIGHYTRIWEK